MKYAKIVYWNGESRLVKEEQVKAIEQMIALNKPFRLNHKDGTDFVQPKSISMITQPRLDELPRREYDALPEPRRDEKRVPTEIVDILKESIKYRLTAGGNEKADELKGEYERRLADWQKANGIIKERS